MQEWAASNPPDKIKDTEAWENFANFEPAS